MNKKWPWKPLGKVCKTGSGGTPLKQRREYYEDGTIPWVMSGEVSQGEVWKATKFITQKGLENSAAKIFPRNTVLVAMYGATAGEVGILRFEAATNQAVCGILPTSQFIPEFLFYFLFLKKEKLVAQATGNAQPNISQIKIKNMNTPIPPLPEQKRIVAILDEAFAAIAIAKANAEKNLKNARAIFESKLNEVFTQRGEGWVERIMSDICDITSTLVDPRDDNYLDLTHVGAGNIEIKTGALANLKTAREEGLVSGKFSFDTTMVLYSKIRPYLVKVARPDFCGLCSADIYPLAPLDNAITRDYLYYLLVSKPFTDYAIRGSARAGMPKVNRKHLFNYKAWLPPVEQQPSISTQLDQLKAATRKLATIYEMRVAALDQLKQSLLHHAFTGQLTESSAEEVLQEVGS